MAFYDVNARRRIESPSVDAFIADLVQIYKRHGMSLAHEDGQGAFIVETLKETNIEWLQAAHVDFK